jgi:hypothetical protein
VAHGDAEVISKLLDGEEMGEGGFGGHGDSFVERLFGPCPRALT